MRSILARSALACFLVAVLLPFIGLIFFTHPAIDDFDNVETVAHLGKWGAQWYWYTHWSGRFVAIGFSTLLNPLAHAPNETISAMLPFLRGILVALVLGLLVAMQHFFSALLLAFAPAAKARAPQRKFAWVLALIVMALTFNALPEPFSLLYWYSGAVNYQFPLVLALVFLATMLRALHLPAGAGHLQQRGWVVLASLSLAGAVGGGEITLLTCLVVLGGTGLWLHATGQASNAYQKRIWVVWLTIGVAVACLMLGAPGNWQRLALKEPDPGLWYHRWLLLAPRTLLAAARLAARPPVLGALLVLVAFVLLAAPGLRAARPEWKKLVVVIGGYLLINTLGIALMKASFMHDVWVEAMPDRVVNVLVLQLLISTTALALWARPWLPTMNARTNGRRLARVCLPVATLLALLIGQVRWAWQELLFVAPAYSRQMLRRYATLEYSRQRHREAVLEPLQLPAATSLLAPIPSARRRADVSIELHPDYIQKNNQFLAHYYGLPRVRLSKKPPGM